MTLMVLRVPWSYQTMTQTSKTRRTARRSLIYSRLQVRSKLRSFTTTSSIRASSAAGSISGLWGRFFWPVWTGSLSSILVLDSTSCFLNSSVRSMVCGNHAPTKKSVKVSHHHKLMMMTGGSIGQNEQVFTTGLSSFLLCAIQSGTSDWLVLPSSLAGHQQS